MIPALSRKSIVFLFLGVFALLFGVAQGASAATCASYGDGVPADPEWRGAGNPAIDNCEITFSDPTGGSNLSVCKYRILSNSVQTIPTPPPDPGWVDAAGICEGSSATLSIDISIGAGLNCRDNGLDKCEVQFRAEDNAGNSATSPPPIVILDIDYSPPSGGSISYINGFIFVTSVVLTVNDGTDSDSGIDTATRTVKRRSSVLVDGGCPGYGSFTEVSTTGDYPLLFDSGLVSGNCYRYQYLVKDNIGNLATYTSPSVVKVDAVAPKVEAFNVIPKDPAWVNIATPDALVSWTVSDTGGSSFKQIEVWRAFDANLNGVLDAGEWDLSPIFIYTGPFGSTGTSPGEYLDDSLVTGTYWYGVHVKDKADNCITEDTSGADKGHCGGVTSDGLDIRPDKGPIKVIVDKTHLITTLTSVADDTVSPYWDTTNNLDTSIELAGEANMLCRWGTPDVVGDVVYASMVNNCFVLGVNALCSLGPLAQSASYTRYVSCRDVAGNDQPINSALPEGNKDVVFGVDWTAPSGSVLINGGATYATSTSVTLGLTCTDSVSLCDKMRFSNDGSSFSAEEAFAASKSWPLTSGDGPKTVYARYKDTAGNESSSFTDTIILDMTFPGTPDLFAPSGTIATTTPTFGWSDVTDSSGVTYTLWVDNNSDFGSLEINQSGLGSSLYTPGGGILVDGTTYYWKARAVDGAGNTGSFPAYNTFKIMLNQAPSVSSVSDSPDPIKANAPITFSVSWSDPDAGDLTKIHICKTNAISGQTCSGGSWCDSASFSSTSPTACNYTTLVGDAGTQNYYAFVCDDDNACSSSIFGTFLVDAIAPTISSWGIAPEAPNWANNASPSITVTWNVSDLGGSHLDKVRVYRALFEAGCDDASKASCVWDQAGSDAVAPPNSDNWDCGATCPDRIVDNPNSGTWWYGMHVLDKAQNETIEPTPPGPKKALVDTIEPNSQIQLPASNTWFSNDFTLDTLDEDLDSGLDTTQCQYKIIPYEDTNGDGIADTERPSSGWLSRTCNAPPSDPVTTITVGSTDYCEYQAERSCWVYVRSQDVAGNVHTPTQPADSVKLYNIDWTKPQLGKLYLTANEGDQTYPIQVQLDQSNTYKVHVTDNLKVSGCSLYIDGIDQGAMTPAVPGCETDCTFTKDFTFTGTGTYHNNYAACKDAANNSKSGTSVDVEVKTLSVDLTAIPSLGSIHTLFDLAGTVSGTMAGNANFKFDCDINDPTWNFEIDNIDLSTSDSDWVTRQGKQTKVTAPDTFAVQDLCQYPSPGTYTAKVFVQRGVGTAEDTVSIPVSANSVPSAINLSVDPPNSTDYCGVTGYPPVRVNWTFSDADPGDTQGAYELEVFQGAVKVVDTGKKSGDTQSYVFQSAGEQLLWDTTYTWQVRVWDSPSDDISLFAPGLSFTTPSHYYPVPDFTWTPALPGAEESVQFIDQTNFACETCGKTWSWNFGDGGSSTSQNPSHTYVEIGAFEVTLQSTDDVGSCSTQKTVNISIPFPEWQEISPF